MAEIATRSHKNMKGTRARTRALPGQNCACPSKQKSISENIVVPGARMELTIATIVPGGKALARPQGYPVVFIDKGIPGQRIEVEITDVKSSRIEARRLKVLQKAENQIEPVCPHFFTCGGCIWQEMPYSEQLLWKRAHVQETLRRVGGIEFPVPELVPSPMQTGFRNKMEFAFGFSPTGITLGLRKRGSREIDEVHTCSVAAPGTMPIVAMIRDFARQSGLPAWNEAIHSGFWRFLVIRSTHGMTDTSNMQEAGDTFQQSSLNPTSHMVYIITGPPESVGQKHHQSTQKPLHGTCDSQKTAAYVTEILQELAASLRKHFPNIVSVLHGIRNHPAQFAIAEQTTVLLGTSTLRETINDLELSMSGDAFFQTNFGVTPLLHEVIRNMVNLNGAEHVLDLFCGTGAIGLSLAASCRTLTGIESVPAAVRDAEQNARTNNITNASFIAGDAVALMKKLASETSARNRPDVVIADPPRIGLGKKLVHALGIMAPEKLVLVSCDTATMARDIAALIQKDYELKDIRALDMFPHTPHMECCCLLQRTQKVPHT